VDSLVRYDALDVGTEVMVETTHGTYRGVLSQTYLKGSHVKLRCLGHDIWLHNRSVFGVRATQN
jgi:hypothetical protein